MKFQDPSYNGLKVIVGTKKGKDKLARKSKVYAIFLDAVYTYWTMNRDG